MNKDRLNEIEAYFYARRENGTRVPIDAATEYFMVRELTDFAFATLAAAPSSTETPVTAEMIQAGKKAIDDYYDGSKDAPFEGSLRAAYKAMLAAAWHPGSPSATRTRSE